jgi:hypothetical protein
MNAIKLIGAGLAVIAVGFGLLLWSLIALTRDGCVWIVGIGGCL